MIAVGSPLGLPGTVTEGIISARNRPVMVSENAAADSPTAYINASRPMPRSIQVTREARSWTREGE